MKNNIKKIVEGKGISLFKLSKGTDITYSTIYTLAHREDLGSTSLQTLAKVASYLKVEIEDLYK